MGYLEDAFQEIAYDFPVLGPTADVLYRDAPLTTFVPGSGFVGTSAIQKIQSVSSATFYASVSIFTAAFSEGPFALFTMRKLSYIPRATALAVASVPVTLHLHTIKTQPDLAARTSFTGQISGKYFDY